MLQCVRRPRGTTAMARREHVLYCVVAVCCCVLQCVQRARSAAATIGCESVYGEIKSSFGWNARLFWMECRALLDGM